MLPEILIGLVVGLVCGCAAAWALLQGGRQEDRQRIRQLEESLASETAAHTERDSRQREEIARLAAERAHLEQDAERSAKALTELHEETNRLRYELFQLQTDLATLRTTLEAERKSAQEKAEARVEMSNQFEVLANRILEEKSKRFTEQNQANLGHLLNPLKEKFGEFQSKVES
ncbi:MAG TPA: hypothetical protein VHY79_19075, partial [Rhizomicrobium sp.]|nr:hypothetical protein [Rhizomicrobium sp.]